MRSATRRQRSSAPAIAALRMAGIDVSGPWPPDTMFTAAARDRYDAAICMYHDQALIPLKTLDMDHGVNVTLGLPIVRTSPDHGTAYDIAGKGIADPSSLIAAIELAADTRRTPRGFQEERAMTLRLGVNVDHVATVRNARGGAHPDPLDAAQAAIAAGADGITIHLREDRRHIRDDDVHRHSGCDRQAAQPGDGGHRRDGRRSPARCGRMRAAWCRSGGRR